MYHIFTNTQLLLVIYPLSVWGMGCISFEKKNVNANNIYMCINVISNIIIMIFIFYDW